MYIIDSTSNRLQNRFTIKKRNPAGNKPGRSRNVSWAIVINNDNNNNDNNNIIQN